MQMGGGSVWRGRVYHHFIIFILIIVSLKQLRVINANSCTLSRARKKVKWPGETKKKSWDGNEMLPRAPEMRGVNINQP